MPLDDSKHLRLVKLGSSRRLRRFLWIAMTLLAAYAGAAVAVAQSSDGTSKKLASIRDEMERGQALYIGGNYAAAAQIFELGYQSHPYSAFLFNAGVCYQRLNNTERALEKFREYLRIDPNAPDRVKVAARIGALEAAAASAASAAAAAAAAVSDGGVDADAGSADGGVPPAAVEPPPSPPSAEEAAAMKSLVVIETEPPGAPLRIFARTGDGAAAFQAGAANVGWSEVLVSRSPASLTLDVGRYHVLVEKFQDFNLSQADIDVLPGHVHHFKANLSQGEFMAFLRVSGNVPGAYVYLDDPKKKRAPWGTAPHGELVSAGQHTLLVESPGFEPLLAKLELSHGEQRELEVRLLRLGYGLLRVDSNAPSIEVRVDESVKGTWKSGEAPVALQVTSGKHRIVITSDGRKTFEGSVEVPRGQVQPVHARMIPKYPRGAAWTEAIIGAAFLGGGTYLGLESNRLHDELEQDRRRGVLEQEDSRVSQGRWFSVGADLGFAVGGALAVLATYDFIKDPLPESSLKLGKPLEFDDPLKKRPTATQTFQAPARPGPEPGAPRRQAGRDALDVQLGAGPSGVSVGGQF